ncbi:putative leader peptide [Streptomyces abyssomicinicus]
MSRSAGEGEGVGVAVTALVVRRHVDLLRTASCLCR